MAKTTGYITLLAKWLIGVALISWRYLWQTTPLHRSEVCVHTDERLPPEVPEELLDERCQPAVAGVGELYHRLFSVRVVDGAHHPDELMLRVKEDLNCAAPTEVVRFYKTRGGMDDMRLGDEFVVRMPGPWDGPVRVVACGPDRFRFVTLRGHLEAGQIEFRAVTEDDTVLFEIETWARPSSRLVHLLYTRLRLAKEMQLNMWVRYCLSIASVCGGRASGGVRIETKRVLA
ncbi:DUF1990 family protein [Saccharopolyspora dendranthemae]|uniref:Uncharacterized protein DUF1990 n=1 Tax=Saccharopolyspora dendranthemae TaxID=1181886 RepID=A0A561U7W5_9PSEU|nr:DUF1990 family protein [Saccharopolyspora dendranthemae]TWF95433.1 uncharacterized protein DUF1990 [Saccharopolyspora dendranthemae]